VLAEQGGPDYYAVLVDGVETGPWYQGDLALLTELAPETDAGAPSDGEPAEMLEQAPEVEELQESALQSDDVTLPVVEDGQTVQPTPEGEPA